MKDNHLYPCVILERTLSSWNWYYKDSLANGFSVMVRGEDPWVGTQEFQKMLRDLHVTQASLMIETAHRAAPQSNPFGTWIVVVWEAGVTVEVSSMNPNNGEDRRFLVRCIRGVNQPIMSYSGPKLYEAQYEIREIAVRQKKDPRYRDSELSFFEIGLIQERIDLACAVFASKVLMSGGPRGDQTARSGNAKPPHFLRFIPDRERGGIDTFVADVIEDAVNKLPTWMPEVRKKLDRVDEDRRITEMNMSTVLNAVHSLQASVNILTAIAKGPLSEPEKVEKPVPDAAPGRPVSEALAALEIKVDELVNKLTVPIEAIESTFDASQADSFYTKLHFLEGSSESLERVISQGGVALMKEGKRWRAQRPVSECLVVGYGDSVYEAITAMLKVDRDLVMSDVVCENQVTCTKPKKSDRITKLALEIDYRNGLFMSCGPKKEGEPK